MRPSFSTSSFSPPRTKRKPRLTFVSLGKPLRRFEVTSKAGQVVVGHACHDRLLWLPAIAGPASLGEDRRVGKQADPSPRHPGLDPGSTSSPSRLRAFPETTILPALRRPRLNDEHCRNPLAHVALPFFFASLISEPDFFRYRQVTELPVARGMAQDEIVQSAWPATALRKQVLQCWRPRAVRNSVEIDWCLAKPAQPTIAGAKPIRL